MKQSGVLIVGLEFYDYVEKIHDLFIKNGYESRILIRKYKMIPNLMMHFVRKRIFAQTLLDFNKDVQHEIEMFKPDKIIVIKGQSLLTHETLQIINELKIPAVLMLWDSISTSVPEDDLKFYSKILLFDLTDERILKRHEVPYSLLGSPVSMKDYYPIIPQPPKDIDIIFVGGANVLEQRRIVIEALVNNFIELKIQIFG